MASIAAEIERLIQDKYLSEELNIDTKLHQLSIECKKKDNHYENNQRGNSETENNSAVKRNKQILKETDLTVARYRSRSLYSPLDGHLEASKIKYLKTLKELRHAHHLQRLRDPIELECVKGTLEHPLPQSRTIFEQLVRGKDTQQKFQKVPGLIQGKRKQTLNINSVPPQPRPTPHSRPRN